MQRRRARHDHRSNAGCTERPGRAVGARLHHGRARTPRDDRTEHSANDHDVAHHHVAEHDVADDTEDDRTEHDRTIHDVTDHDGTDDSHADRPAYDSAAAPLADVERYPSAVGNPRGAAVAQGAG